MSDAGWMYLVRSPQRQIDPHMPPGKETTRPVKDGSLTKRLWKELGTSSLCLSVTCLVTSYLETIRQITLSYLVKTGKLLDSLDVDVASDKIVRLRKLEFTRRHFVSKRLKKLSKRS